jgi:hypothetical protein
MHICEFCNYITTSKCNFKKHNKTQKHISLAGSLGLLHKNMFLCTKCNKEYSYKNSYLRHKNTCDNSHCISNNHIFELERLKKEHEYQLEIERLKNELNVKELANKLEIKEIENKHLQIYVKDSNNTNPPTKNTHNFVNNTVINNTVKISKVEYLNLNFSNVIDINTFIENYKNKFGLNNQQTLTLLENYETDGVNSCISTLVHYLKKSAIQQYKELKGKDISMDDIILPFLLSDKSIREHYEKNVNGKWDKTTMIENIKKIVSITNNQVYNHHNKFLDFTAAQKKRIINGVLKASGYSHLSEISIPDFYRNGDTSNSTTQISSTEITTIKENNKIVISDDSTITSSGNSSSDNTSNSSDKTTLHDNTNTSNNSNL